MANQGDAMRNMLDAISAMRGTGYTQEDIHDLVTAAFDTSRVIHTSRMLSATARTAAD